MGNFISFDSSNNSNNSNNINNDDNGENGEWTLTPETTLTDSTLNIPKDIVNGVNYGINTITTSTEDIFHSINNGLKNLLDLSVDGIDYVVDKIGLHYSSNDTTETPISDTSINTDDLNNLSTTQKNQLLNETTSDDEEDLIPLNKMVLRNGKTYSQEHNGTDDNVDLKQSPLILDDGFIFPFNPQKNQKTIDTTQQIPIDNSSSSVSPISQSQINKYLQSTTSIDLDTQSQISGDENQSFIQQQPQEIQTKTQPTSSPKPAQSTQSITKQPLILDDVELSNTQIQLPKPLSKNETTTSIDTTEIDKKMNDIISKDKISQSSQSIPLNDENTIQQIPIMNSSQQIPLDKSTQQNPLNSTTSSTNTSLLTTLNLNGGNFSSMNLNRF